MVVFLWCLLGVAIAAVAIVGLCRHSRKLKVCASVSLKQAQRRFHAQRERLEAKFLKLAAAHAGPDAPRWVDCDFDDDVAYVRNRTTGQLSAFVAVSIATESEESASPSESPERAEEDWIPTHAADRWQAATAVFRFDCDHWETDGRAILNLSPAEAAQHFNNDWEVVGEELAVRGSVG